MDARPETRRDERSLGELFGDLSRQLSTLIRQEIALARAEMTARAGSAGRGAAMVGIGGVVAYAGFLAIVAAAVLLFIEAGITPWLAALIVGIVVAVIGAALATRGRQEIARTSLAPQRTIETIRDDAAMAKESLK
jgi:xanthine/uracil permease